MKIKFMVLCFVLLLALPLNAFALQANITFERLDVPETGASILGNAIATILLGDPKNAIDIGDEFGASSARIPGLTAEVNGDGGSASAFMSGLAKITTPVNASNFVPNHCISILEHGTCIGDPECVGTATPAYGRLEAGYATSRGLANAPTATNQYATMEVFIHFLAVGNCDNLAVQGLIHHPPLGPGLADIPSVIRGGLWQRIKIGDTDVRVFNMGQDVFVTEGRHAASTEKSLWNFTTPTLIIGGCGVNHWWHARQRVDIDSDGQEEVDVVMESQLTTGCGIGDGGDPLFGFNFGFDDRGIFSDYPLFGGDPYTWVSVASGSFFARDYCSDDVSVRFDRDGNPVDVNGDRIFFDEDGNPVDADGNPIVDADGEIIVSGGNGAASLFCEPRKVLINNTLVLGQGEEAATLTESSPGVNLGIAELNGTPVAAFRDLETIMVQVGPGSVFQCNLIINDADTGQPVASFDPADAAYDAATGMAVFDLSAEGPFAPGRYDVRVANLYQADVYVAIPGDVNLDGTVDTVDRQIIEDNIEAGATTTGVWTTGDINNDGVVDGLDLAIVNGQLPLLGDINGDGFVNLGDIGPLIDILFGGRPTQVEADINGDGFINLGDIGPFIDILFPQ